MHFNNEKVFSQVTSQLGEIELQISYATAMSTQFVKRNSYRYIRKKDVTPDSDIRTSFGNGIEFNRIPAGRQDEYFLIVQLGGEITSVDELLLERCYIDSDEIHIWLAITKVESPDGEPSPVEAFILVPLNETITIRRKLTIEFNGFYRSYEGKTSPLEKAPIEAISVVFAKD